MTAASETIAPAGAATSGFDALFFDAAARAGIGGWSCDLATEALTWTRGVHDLFGLPADARLDRRATVAMYDVESRAALERLRGDAIARCRPFTLDARIVRADREPRWMRITAQVESHRGRATRLYGLKQDITAERAQWDAMRRLAERDALTGLTSRAIFQSRFLDAPAAAPTITPLGALVLLDVDGFKQVNDRLGHAAGDACLAAVAQRVAAAFGNAPMIARIGGDEFAVLVDTPMAAMALDLRVSTLLARIRAPIAWGGQVLSVGASAGIALVDDPYAYDAQALFVAADAALYAAKSAGRNTVRTAVMPGVLRAVG